MPDLRKVFTEIGNLGYSNEETRRKGAEALKEFPYDSPVIFKDSQFYYVYVKREDDYGFCHWDVITIDYKVYNNKVVNVQKETPADVEIEFEEFFGPNKAEIVDTIPGVKDIDNLIRKETKNMKEKLDWKRIEISTTADERAYKSIKEARSLRTPSKWSLGKEKKQAFSKYQEYVIPVDKKNDTNQFIKNLHFTEADLDYENHDVDYKAEFEEFCAQSSMLEDNGSGYYKYTPYHDYRDEGLSDEQVVEILEAENPYDKLTDFLYDYDPVYDWDWDNIISEFKDFLDEKGLYSDINFYNPDECGFYIYDYVYIDDDEFYLSQKYKCRLELDTGDANYDFTLNPYYDTDLDEELDDQASIVWLAKQQGYTKEQLQDALKNGSDDKFLKSCRVEYENTASHMNTLTFLCTATLKQLCDFKANKGSTITLDPSTTCGFYDEWSGGGSVLSIELVKPVVIPSNVVFKFIPDKGQRYSVSEVYGMSGSAFDSEVKVDYTAGLSEAKLKEDSKYYNFTKEQLANKPLEGGYKDISYRKRPQGTINKKQWAANAEVAIAFNSREEKKKAKEILKNDSNELIRYGVSELNDDFLQTTIDSLPFRPMTDVVKEQRGLAIQVPVKYDATKEIPKYLDFIQSKIPYKFDKNICYYMSQDEIEGYEDYEFPYKEGIVAGKENSYLFYVVKNIDEGTYLYLSEDGIKWVRNLNMAEAYDDYDDAQDALDNFILDSIPDCYQGSLDDETSEECLNWQDEEAKHYKVVGIKGGHFHEKNENDFYDTLHHDHDFLYSGDNKVGRIWEDPPYDCGIVCDPQFEKYEPNILDYAVRNIFRVPSSDCGPFIEFENDVLTEAIDQTEIDNLPREASFRKGIMKESNDFDSDEEERDYLLDKERCCSLDKGERYRLQSLLDEYGYPEEKLWRYRVEGIDWDTDGEEVDLPKDDDVEVYATYEDEAEDKVVDALSDKYGWLVNGVDNLYLESKKLKQKKLREWNSEEYATMVDQFVEEAEDYDWEKFDKWMAENYPEISKKDEDNYYDYDLIENYLIEEGDSDWIKPDYDPFDYIEPHTAFDDDKIEMRNYNESREKDIVVNFPITIMSNHKVNARDAKKLLNYLYQNKLLRLNREYFVTDSNGNETSWDLREGKFSDYILSCEIVGTDENGNDYDTMNELCFLSYHGKPSDIECNFYRVY